MKKICIKSISFLLILSMLILPSLMSCKKEESKKEETTVSTSVDGTLSEEDAYLSSLPQKDYEKNVFTILCTSQMDMFYIEEEDASASVISEGVHNRNLAVEEMYNIDLEYISMDGNFGGSKAFAEKVRTDIVSGAGELDLVLGQSYYCMAMALEGFYHNLANSKYLHLDKPWYHSMINSNGTIDGKLFGGSGSFIMAQIANATCIFFNKKMAADNGLEKDLYNLVENKKWTYDVLNEMSAAVGSDLDENEIYDENDSYGFVGGMHTEAGLITGFNCPATRKNADGSISLTVYTTHTTDVVSKLHDFIVDNNKVYLNKDDLKSLDVFLDSRSLFCSIFLNAMTYESTRNMEDAYGVLPQPMYNEEQNGYKTYTNRWELFYIPNTCDTERSEIITEVLNYYSYKELIPKYYETSLQNKLSDTEMDSKMLDIIIGTLTYDFSTFFDNELSGLSTFLVRCIDSGNVSSAWKVNGRKYEKLLGALFDSYKSIDA